MKVRKMVPALRWKVNEPSGHKVFLPYTEVTPLLQTVVDCLRIQFVQPQLVKVGDDDRYWRLLRDAWEEGEEFFVVEQDVIVWPGGIEHLAMCDQDWCTFPTLCHGRLIKTTFGAVKFGKQLVERHPHFWDDIDTAWRYLDAHFAEKMGWPFILPHAHHPFAAHINEAQWPDSISRQNARTRVGWRSMEVGGVPVAYMGTDDEQWLTS
jgi:hypothetical protein